MRPKFRAWHKAEKRMYQVSTLYFPLLKAYDVKQVELHDKGAVQAFTIGEEVELMQYTGLKDKHGKEIFEGDIIHRPDIGIPMVVRWNEKNAGFDLAMRDPSDFDAVTIFYTQFAQDYEIIGNFYEHKHLLLPDPH